MDIQITQIGFQVLNFLILLFVFKKFLLKPIIKVLDDRANRIKEGLDAADKNIKMHQEVEGKQELLLKDARSQAKEIINEAKKEAESITKKAHEEAKSGAKQALEKERQAFEAQINREMAKFQDNIAKIVTDATNSVLRGSLDKGLQQSIIENQIKELKPQLFN